MTEPLRIVAKVASILFGSLAVALLGSIVLAPAGTPLLRPALMAVVFFGGALLVLWASGQIPHHPPRRGKSIGDRILSWTDSL